MFWYTRHRIAQAWRNFLRPPAVVIRNSGQLTSRPQVYVSVCSINGSQSVYCWDADDQGNAKATMYAKGLARIMRRRLCVTWRGKRYRCVGASRMGDVWLKGSGPPNAFYDHRVDIEELSDWRRPADEG